MDWKQAATLNAEIQYFRQIIADEQRRSEESLREVRARLARAEEWLAGQLGIMAANEPPAPILTRRTVKGQSDAEPS